MQILAARRLIGTRPAAGRLVVLVMHGIVVQEATGQLLEEGEAIVFRPLGDSRFRVVGRARPPAGVGDAAAPILGRRCRPARACGRPRSQGCGRRARGSGGAAPHHDRAAERRAAERDRRLLRGRAESRHDGDERLGCRRAGLVAEPAGESERLWHRCREIDRNLDAYAARHPRETAVVVFEPAP
jgi:hypothetical protein